jgi:hypothetical protein
MLLEGGKYSEAYLNWIKETASLLAGSDSDLDFDHVARQILDLEISIAKVICFHHPNHSPQQLFLQLHLKKKIKM